MTTLDLEDLLAGWDCAAGEICARTVVGRDGAELLQLRVDLGVVQMFPDGSPDGKRFHGQASVLEYLERGTRLGRRDVSSEEWRELERELCQTNYRRLALSSLVEDALGRNDVETAKLHLKRALRDTETCLARIRFAAENGPDEFGRSSLALRPTLVFHRGRLGVQLRVAEGRCEEAVEEAQRGAQQLDELLAELGLDEEQRGHDPGIEFLRDLERRLRRDYRIPLTLRERFQDALEREDYEAAARLRGELRRRGQDQPLEESEPEGES